MQTFINFIILINIYYNFQDSNAYDYVPVQSEVYTKNERKNFRVKFSYSEASVFRPEEQQQFTSVNYDNFLGFRSEEHFTFANLPPTINSVENNEFVPEISMFFPIVIRI